MMSSGQREGLPFDDFIHTLTIGQLEWFVCVLQVVMVKRTEYVPNLDDMTGAQRIDTLMEITAQADDYVSQYKTAYKLLQKRKKATHE